MTICTYYNVILIWLVLYPVGLTPYRIKWTEINWNWNWNCPPAICWQHSVTNHCSGIYTLCLFGHIRCVLFWMDIGQSRAKFKISDRMQLDFDILVVYVILYMYVKVQQKGLREKCNDSLKVQYCWPSKSLVTLWLFSWMKDLIRVVIYWILIWVWVFVSESRKCTRQPTVGRIFERV